MIYGFNRIPFFKIKKNRAIYFFTIIVPFRNEAENIPLLAKSLLKMAYPKTYFEVLWVNDSSTDNSIPLLTEFIVKNANWKLIDNQRKSNSPKKDAIQTAIEQSNYDYILTTDADCKVPSKWLQSFSNFMEVNKEVKMIAAPVSYAINNNFLHQFQLLDFLSLIGTTIGSFGINKPFMCNGANLCYSKQAFYKVNGFEGNNNIASGDDVFLLEKFKKHFPKQVGYLKSIDSLVVTKPENTLKNLINQRIRWASKTSSTKSVFGKFIGIVVFLQNFISLWSLIYGLWVAKYTFLAVLILLSKLCVDYILLKKMYQFTHQKLGLAYYILGGFLYPFFVVFVVVKSVFTKVTWKGRTFYK